MSNDTENCPYCGTENSFKVTHCVQCKEELPWANWVQATQRPSEAIGAQVKHHFRPGEGQLQVSGGLPRGALLKVMMTIVPLLLLLLSVYFAISRFAGNKLIGDASNGATGSVAEQFKKANPAFEQDEAKRKGQ